MAWIAEMMLPSHLHVDKVCEVTANVILLIFLLSLQNKTIQFDQWRLAHLAEFGIYYFSETPRTPAPERKQPAPTTTTTNNTNTNDNNTTNTTSNNIPKTPAGKRRQARQREAAEKKAKEEKEEKGEKGEKEEREERGEKPNGDLSNGHSQTDDNNNVESNDLKSNHSETVGDTLKNNDNHSEEIILDQVDINEKKDTSKAQCTQEKTGDAFLNGNKSNSLFKSKSETQKNSSNKEKEEIPEESQPETTEIPRSQENIVLNDKNGENKNTTERSPGEDDASRRTEAGGKTTKHSTNSDAPTPSEGKSVTCNICEETFLTMIEHNLHKKQCFPAPDFLSSGMEDVIEAEYRKAEETLRQFICSLCDKHFTNMVWLTKHQNNCKVAKGEKTKEEKDFETEKIEKPNCKEVNSNKSEYIQKESAKTESQDISKQDPQISPDISKKDPLKSKSPDISTNDPQLSKSPDISKQGPLSSKSQSDLNTETKIEPDLDIPKEEVITRNSTTRTNEKSDEVKNVNKKSEKIVKNPAPTPIKQGEDNSTGKETNKKETSQADLQSVNKKNEVKERKQIKSRAKKGSETENKKKETSGSVEKDFSQNSSPDKTKNSGKLI